jgi:hypothetical protein
VNDRRAAAVALLDERGAATITHLGSDLRTHLFGTENLLRSWRCDEPVALAGLCHAAYGTDGFPVALLGITERHRLRAAIGGEAEQLVYRYAACDRRAVYPQFGGDPVWFVDRFTGEHTVVDDVFLERFAVLTAANELDLALRGVFDAATVASLDELFASLEPYAPRPLAAARRGLDNAPKARG